MGFHNLSVGIVRFYSNLALNPESKKIGVVLDGQKKKSGSFLPTPGSGVVPAPPKRGGGVQPSTATQTVIVWQT